MQISKESNLRGLLFSLGLKKNAALAFFSQLLQKMPNIAVSKCVPFDAVQPRR